MTEHTTPEITAEAVAPATNKRWYVVHAYSGMEKAVERNLRERIDRSELQDKFGRILVPMEEVVELKNGKKSVSERRFFPAGGQTTTEVGLDFRGLDDVYVVMAFHDGGFVLNYLFHPADGSFGFNVGDRESSETHVRAIFPDAAGEDLLLAPIDYHTAALEDVLGMTATELFAMPFESISLKSLGFVENEEVPGWLYVYNDSGDYFDLSIHDPKQEAWEGGGEVRFYTPLSEEYRIVVTYHIDEKQFTVKADDNHGGGAEYRFLIDTNELVDIWCSDDSLTVEQYFMKAIDDPSITDTYDIYHYAIKLMVGAVEGTFGMGIEELYALPID